MEPEKRPTKMITDQIALLRSEERKLKKFVNYNQDAKSTVDVHLKEIEKKKQRLYDLCEMMDMDSEYEDDKDNQNKQTIDHHKIPLPTGRFGSALISWEHN